MSKYRTKEKTSNRVKRWRKNNPDKVLEYRKKYRSKCREYYRKNKDLFRDRMFKKYYNISLNEYNDMMISQKRRCLICGKHQSKCKKKFAIDHDHETGKVRGLLCDRCNLGIGHFNDDINLLNNAILYLKEK